MSKFVFILCLLPPEMQTFFFVTDDVSRDYARALHMEIISANYSIAEIRI